MIKLIQYIAGENWNADYNELFNTEADELAKTLKFESREEYLLFVEKWKNDYKTLSALMQTEKLWRRITLLNRPEKRKRFEEEIAKLDAQISEEEMKRYLDAQSKYQELLSKEERMSYYIRFIPGVLRCITQYMLVVRRAGKIVAKRETRNVIRKDFSLTK